MLSTFGLQRFHDIKISGQSTGERGNTAFSHLLLSICIAPPPKLADLSEALQQDAFTLATANRKIKRTMEVFVSRKESPECFYKEAITAIAAGKFQGVPLSKSGKQEHEINCKQFYQGLVDRMGARVLSDADKRFSNSVTIAQPESYQKLLSCSPDHGESELREMYVKFNLLFSATKEAFHEYKNTKGAVIVQQFKKLVFADRHFVG